MIIKINTVIGIAYVCNLQLMISAVNGIVYVTDDND